MNLLQMIQVQYTIDKENETRWNELTQNRLQIEGIAYRIGSFLTKKPLIRPTYIY